MSPAQFIVTIPTEEMRYHLTRFRSFEFQTATSDAEIKAN